MEVVKLSTEKTVNEDIVSEVNEDVIPEPSEFSLAIRELLKRPPALFGVFFYFIGNYYGNFPMAFFST